MRPLRLLLRAAAWAAGGFALAIAVVLLAAPLFGARPLTVLSGSMEPTLGVGDVVVAQRIAPLDAHVGDIVTFHDPHHSGRLVTHRVRALRARGASVDFVTRGDANNASESWQVARDGQVARAVLRVPAIGRALILLRTRTGILALVVAPLLLLAILEVVSIWRPGRKEPSGERAG